ncbi:MAG: FG-GAP-like repeat-containing protein [Bacteroidales bacterium]|nr:FG-GAP-like repeat-containing protein [Bacteroidales bacterium]
MRAIVLFLLLMHISIGNIVFAQKSTLEKIDESNLVGTIPGEMGVSPTGELIYSIPLDIPTGRAGMTPDIGLVYNSRNEGNILGKGWSVTGFSAITRANPSVYYNGFADNIDFEGDEYLLDGAHLIKVGENGGITEYRKETDFSTKIEMLTGSHGTYFKVYEKSGLIMEYGNSPNSRHINSQNNPDLLPIAWHICQIGDRMGNITLYNYDAIPSTGEIHPTEVSYSGHEGKSSGHTKVKFEYDTEELSSNLQRTTFFEILVSSYPGFQPYFVTNSWLLKSIRITNELNKPIRDYEFGYFENKGVCGEYFIEKIDLATYSGNEKVYINPTRFDWAFYSPKYEPFANNEQPDYIKAITQTTSIGLDLTGDGKDEIATFKIKQNDPGNMTDIDLVVTIYFDDLKRTIDIPVARVVYSINQLKAIDYNMDGDDELLFVDDQGLKIYDYDKVSNTMNQVYFYPYQVSCFPGDFTGDGINDILVVSNTYCKVLEGHYTSSSNSFTFVPNTAILAITDKRQIENVGDFNGDGVMEIIWKSYPNYIYKIYSFSSENGFESGGELNIANYSTTTSQVAYFNDFNNDGKTDICYLMKGTNNVLHKTLYFSYGAYFIEKDGVGVLNGQIPSLVEDFNLDGRADFMYLSSGYSNWKLNFKYTQPDGISTEGGFGSEIPIEMDHDGLEWLSADVDGNGVRDFVFLYSKKHLIPPSQKLPSYGVLNIFSYKDTGIGLDVIQSAINGLGVKTTATFAGIPNLGATNHQFPISNTRLKATLVSEIYTVGDNQQKWNRKTYTFNNPVSHLQGRGYLGFMQTKVVTWPEQLTTITNFSLISKNDKYYSLVSRHR